MKRAVWEHPVASGGGWKVASCRGCHQLFKSSLREGLCPTCIEARKPPKLPQPPKPQPPKLPPDGGYISVDTQGYVYVMVPELMGEILPAIKIGFTRNIETRRAHLQKGACYRMLVHASMRGTLRDETRIRTRLTPWRIQGKTDWFQRLPVVLEILGDEFSSVSDVVTAHVPPEHVSI